MNVPLIVGVIAVIVIVAGFAFVSYSPTTYISPQQTQTTTTTPGVSQIKLDIYHTGYEPSTITVNKGDKVKILAVAGPGTGWHKHAVTIDEYGINQAVRTEDDKNPQVIEFTADKTGSFRIYCGTCDDADGFGKGVKGTHPAIQATLIVK